MNSSQIDRLKSDPGALRVYSQRLKLKRDGHEYAANCPFHADKTPSLKLYEHQGVLMWKCFGCHLSGNILQFVERFDKVDFNTAVEKVQTELGSRQQRRQEQQVVNETFRPLAEPPSAAEGAFKTMPLERFTTYEQALVQSKAAQQWLAGRGITLDTAQRMHTGFRQDVGRLAGESKRDIAAAGWLAFPSIRGDQVVAIKYRSIVRKAFCKQPGMATDLYNVPTIDPLEPVYLTEGEIDALTLEQAGFRAVSLPSGSTTLSGEMIDTLLEADHVILAGDGDTVGQEALNKAWAVMKERTFMLKWPDDKKDANEVFLTTSAGKIVNFKQTIDNLTLAAKANPVPGFYSLQETMLTMGGSTLADHPGRLRFPWRSVDRMAVLLGGSVTLVTATNTGMGKTQWVTNATVHNAKAGECVVNYQVELSKEEFSNIVAAHLLNRDRNHLTKPDYELAAKTMGQMKYYVGCNPLLTTVTPVLDLIEAAIKRLGPSIVVLDHIHFICRNEDNEVQAQANAMQRIKNLARTYGVKFIVVGQPRKSNQQNRGKVIHISDNKGSEAITSDSDAVFIIHRDCIRVKDPNSPPKDEYESRTEVHLKKARSKGDGGAFAVLQFDGKTASFYAESADTTPFTEPPAVAGGLGGDLGHPGNLI